MPNRPRDRHSLCHMELKSSADKLSRFEWCERLEFYWLTEQIQLDFIGVMWNSVCSLNASLYFANNRDLSAQLLMNRDFSCYLPSKINKSWKWQIQLFKKLFNNDSKLICQNEKHPSTIKSNYEDEAFTSDFSFFFLKNSFNLKLNFQISSKGWKHWKFCLLSVQIF